MCQEKGSLLNQKEMLLHMNAEENRGVFFSASLKQAMSHFLGSRDLVCVLISLEDKCHNNKCHPSSFNLDFIPE